MPFQKEEGKHRDFENHDHRSCCIQKLTLTAKEGQNFPASNQERDNAWKLACLNNAYPKQFILPVSKAAFNYPKHAGHASNIRGTEQSTQCIIMPEH